MEAVGVPASRPTPALRARLCAHTVQLSTVMQQAGWHERALSACQSERRGRVTGGSALADTPHGVLLRVPLSLIHRTGPSSRVDRYYDNSGDMGGDAGGGEGCCEDCHCDCCDCGCDCDCNIM